MRVKCIKSSGKVISGVVYEDTSFWNGSKTSRWLQGKINLDGYGRHNISNFTDESGNILPPIDYSNPNKKSSSLSADSPLNINDILICDSDRYKYLIKDQKYRVVDIKEYEKGLYRHKYTNIKLEGYNRWIKYNAYSFKRLSTKESRELAISQILNKPENFSVEFVRKFEKLNKVKSLMECLSRSILDKHRHHYSILEWAVEKTSKNFGIEVEDFDNILDKPLSEIIKLIEN